MRLRASALPAALLLSLALGSLPAIRPIDAQGAPAEADAAGAARRGAAHADARTQDPPADPALYDDSVVREIAFTFEQADWLAHLQANGCARGGPGGGTSVAAKDVPVTMAVDGTTLEQVGIRCKGNSSLGISGPKKPFNITTDSFVAGQDLWGFDVMNLNNNWNDPSLLRDAIGLKLLGDYMPISRFTFAKVTINGTYIGLYSMVEQINGEWADHWYQDNGLTIRGDSPVRITFDSSTLNWKGEDLAPYKQGYEVKGKDAGSDDGYIQLRELTRALDAPVSAGGLADADLATGIREKLNVDSALWHIAGTNILAHYDSYYVGKNHYLFAPSRDPRFDIIIWDLGLAFGTFGLRSGAGGPGGGGGPAAALVDPFVQADAANRPLIRRLLAVPEFRADYLAHYRALLHERFTEDWITEVGQSYQDLIRAAAQEEVAAQGKISGSFTFAQFLANLRDPISGGGGGGGGGGGRGMSAPGILALTKERRAYLLARDDMKLPQLALSDRNLSPAAPKADDAVTVRLRFSGADAAAMQSVQLRYRVSGRPEQTLAMVQEGGDWTAVIPGQRAGKTVTWFLRTAIADGRVTFFPSANYTQPYHYQVAAVALPDALDGDLLLNELMAENTVTVADESGIFEDWLELYNRGDRPLSLAGLHLSDDPLDPWTFALPDRQLAPGEHLLVWLDGDVAEGPLHAPFRLDRKGETLTLSSRTNILDRVAFGPLGADQSFGRRSSGATDWLTCGQASPGAANHCDGLPAPTAEPTATGQAPSATPRASSTPTPMPTQPAEAMPMIYLPSAGR